jgi:hypothetical protein
MIALFRFGEDCSEWLERSPSWTHWLRNQLESDDNDLLLERGAQLRCN